MRKGIILVLVAGFICLSETYGFQDKGSVIQGIVTDTAGNPLPGASIKLANTFLGVHSRNDGTFSLSGLRDGIYLLNVSFIGYEPQLTEINLSGQSDLKIRLKEKPLLTGEVIINAVRAGNHTPLAYSTIDSEKVRKHNSGQDMPFLLSLTPSLVETSEAGNGVGYTNLRIRGTDPTRINVTIDGIPLNDPESQQVFWVDLPDLASSVDNIQVQRGVGTSSNGAGAFGATISIQTRSPENEPFAQVNATAGSFNTNKKMIAAGTGLLAEKFALQIRLSELKSDGFIDRTGSDHRSGYISGVYRTERSRLKANVILGEEHTGIGWWGVPKEMLDVNRRYNPAGEYTDGSGIKRYYENESDNFNQNHYQLIHSLKLTGDLTINTALHYTSGKGYYEEFREDARLPGYGLPAVSIGDTLLTESDLIRRKWISNNFYGLITSLKFSTDRLEITAGGSGNLYSGDHYGRIIWMKYSGSVEKDHQWYLNTGTKRELSIFGKADYSLSDKISVFGDIQYRYISYKISGEDDDLKDIGQDHKFNFFNPKAGLFFSISQNHDAFISFSVANREPTRADFKEAAGDPGATPRPETLFDTELGYRIRGENYSASLNIYRMVYKDQLVPTGELSSTGYSIMTNVGKSSRTGIELTAGLRFRNILNWDLGATLSRNKIRDFIEYYIDYNTSDWSEEYKSTNLGTVDIAYSPSVTAISDMNFTIFRNTELHFISKYVGKQYFDNTMSPERMIDPYFINNLRFDFRPVPGRIKNVELQLLINNIFNTQYESNAYGGNWYEDGIEKSWSYWFPQAGVNFMIRAGVTF